MPANHAVVEDDGMVRTARLVPTRLVAACAITGLLLAACSDKPATLGDRAGERTERTDPPESTDGSGAVVDTVLDTVPGGTGSKAAAWTFMVYIAGDNNLEEDALADLQQMEAGASDQINIVALVDRSAEFVDTPFEQFGDWSGTRAMRITPDGVVDLGVSGDVNMAEPKVLEDFVAQAAKAYPAEHTALVLWDHGGGWRGYAADAVTHSVLSSEEIAGAVTGGLATAGVDRLDVVIFDACLMADSAVVFAMQPVADVLLASEEVVPAHGLDYTVLADAATGDVAHFTSTLLAGYAAESVAQGDAESVTMSIIDLGKTAALQTAMGELAGALATVSGAEAAGFLRAAEASLAFAYDADPAANYNLRDLGQLLSGFRSTDPAIAAAVDAVQQALDAAVIDHQEGSAFRGATGISVYTPTSIDYFDTRYDQSPTAQAWAAVLDEIYNHGADAVVSTDSAFTAEPTGLFDASGVSVVAPVDPAIVPNIVQVTVVYGIAVGDGTYLALGAAPGGVVDAANGIVGGSVPLLRFEVTVDGFANSLLAYYSAAPNPDDPGVVIVSTPLLYFAPGATEPMQLVLRAALDVVTAKTLGQALYATASNGTVAEFAPDPAGTFQTYIPLVGVDGTLTPVPSADFDTPQSIPADLSRLEVGFQQITPGDGTSLSTKQIAAGLRVVDSGGTAQFVMVPVPTQA